MKLVNKLASENFVRESVKGGKGKDRGEKIEEPKESKSDIYSSKYNHYEDN